MTDGMSGCAAGRVARHGGTRSEAVAERMADRPLQNVMEPGWAEALEPVAGRIKDMGDFLRAELAAGRR